MKDTQTTALLLTGFLGLLCFVGPALDAEDHGYEHEVAREELDKQPVSERAALQADLDIAAGKFTGLYQKRRDDRAIREQQQRLGQTFGGGL